jgi:phospholipase C
MDAGEGCLRVSLVALLCAGLSACMGFGSGLVGDLGGLGRSEQVKADGIRGTVLDVTGSRAAVQDERSRTIFMVEVSGDWPGRLEPGTIVDLTGHMENGVLRADSVDAAGSKPWPRAETVNEDAGRIQHVLFLLQENHSFDNYFGSFPGADGIPAGVKVEGVAPFHLRSFRTGNLAHGQPAVTTAVHGGAMDRFVTAERSSDTMGYYDEEDIPNYWAYARRFALADHFFSPSAGPSLPNHLFALGATAGAVITNTLRPPSGGYAFPSLPERLEEAGVSGKVYDGRPDPRFSALDPFSGFRSTMTRADIRSRLVNTAELFRDLRTGHLPQAAWIFPDAEESEHPLTDIRVGMWYVTAVVNALMKSPYWRTTVLVVSWDEYGGFYDHVPPPRVNGAPEGIRVPALIISSRARPGYVDHTQYDFTSVLKLMENTFGVSPLSERDAEAQDISGSLDMSPAPLPTFLIGKDSASGPAP